MRQGQVRVGPGPGGVRAPNGSNEALHYCFGRPVLRLGLVHTKPRTKQREKGLHTEKKKTQLLGASATTVNRNTLLRTYSY